MRSTAKFFQAYVDENGLSVKEGLYELLRFLKEENIKRAVATSSSHDRTLKNLKGAGILEDFQAVITGGWWQRQSRHPRST